MRHYQLDEYLSATHVAIACDFIALLGASTPCLSATHVAVATATLIYTHTFEADAIFLFSSYWKQTTGFEPVRFSDIVLIFLLGN